jgi:hypothetical protein
MVGGGMESIRDIRRWRHTVLFCAFLAMLPVSTARSSDDDNSRDPWAGAKIRSPGMTPVIDGEFVHNVGNLQMNVTNWGFFGSLPKSRYPMSDVPSAQYPAGSGIEYLYAAGIWVGAERNGVPFVSTGYPETEFYPSLDPKDTIYRSYEGDPRGESYPGPADDDGDGLVDEDWLNGRDDDGDGRIDEDFAARGKQMFSCWFSDDQPQARTIWPEHEPLGVRVRQESYQWGEEDFQDFVGVRYWIDNIGDDFLTSLYIGIYADLDAGPREFGSYHLDDMVGFFSGAWCVMQDEAEVPVHISVAYVYDADGDNGLTPSYFGIAFLGHSTDANGKDGLPWFPSRMLNAFRTFKGLVPYVDGGDPTNDFERYDVMATRAFDQNTISTADYRILLSCGPFSYLAPGSSFFIDFAFVGGSSLDDMLDHASTAQKVWDGIWYDLDGDPQTGVIGRESPVEGPLTDYDPDPCDPIIEMYDIPKFEIIWSNLDCGVEHWKYKGDSDCYRKIDAGIEYYMTGVGGMEHQLNWKTGSAPVLPNMRVVPRDNVVEVYWDDFSEIIPDPVSRLLDFEGYQVWRAEGWHRPVGTTEDTGPGRELWFFLEQRDIVNGVSPDLDFRETESGGGWVYEPLEGLPEREQYLDYYKMSLMEYPLDPVPCPPGLCAEVCDTLESIARYSLGFEGGRRFYRYIDREAKNGLPYFYSVTSYDHVIRNGIPVEKGRENAPMSNFKFVRARSEAQEPEGFSQKEIFVVPNPVTDKAMEPWRLEPNNDDPTGLRCEFRNLPGCRSTIRIYTVSGDLVEVIRHDGSEGDGTAAWNLISRNGQDITSGVYLFSVEPEDGRFRNTIGKFVVIR